MKVALVAVAKVLPAATLTAPALEKLPDDVKVLPLPTFKVPLLVNLPNERQVAIVNYDIGARQIDIATYIVGSVLQCGPRQIEQTSCARERAARADNQRAVVGELTERCKRSAVGDTGSTTNPDAN